MHAKPAIRLVLASLVIVGGGSQDGFAEPGLELVEHSQISQGMNSLHMLMRACAPKPAKQPLSI
jgi:hypothetical protein